MDERAAFVGRELLRAMADGDDVDAALKRLSEVFAGGANRQALERLRPHLDFKTGVQHAGDGVRDWLRVAVRTGQLIREHLIGNYVRRVEIGDGALHIEFGQLANENIKGKWVTLQPLVVKGSPASPMSWRCARRQIPDGMIAMGENRTTVDNKFLPASCRA